MYSDPWPLALAAFLTWFANFRTKIAIHGPSLGISAARITQIAQEYNWLFFAHTDTLNSEAEWHERVAWRDILFRADDGADLGPYPSNDTVVVPAPPIPPAGILDRLRETVQQCKTAPAFNASIEAELGIGTPPKPERDPVPTPKVTAGENSHVMIDSPLRGWSAQEIESRRNGGPWELIAVVVRRKYTDTRPPLVTGQPEVREYRLRFRDGDTPLEVYSDIVLVTTKP